MTTNSAMPAATNRIAGIDGTQVFGSEIHVMALVYLPYFSYL